MPSDTSIVWDRALEEVAIFKGDIAEGPQIVPLTILQLGISGYHVLFSEQMMFGGPTMVYPVSQRTVMFSSSAY